MKVLLVSFFNDESYGVRSLHATLTDKKIDTQMMFFKSEMKIARSNHHEKVKENFKGDMNNASTHEIDLFIDFIKSNNFDLVGFSLVSQHFTLYKRIYNRLQELDICPKIVVGGWEPSLNPEICIKYTDYLCVGEGEGCLVDLVEGLRDKREIANTPNFWVKNGGVIKKNPVAPLHKNLSDYPVPIFEDKLCYYIENNELVNKEPYYDNIRYGTFIGRGCPFSCTYCSNVYMAQTIYPKSWSRIRYRSVEHVKEEVSIVKEKLTNVKCINFYDEIFTPKTEWIDAFFSWYKEKIKLPFFCFFYPGTCSDEKCKTLSEAGLKGVWIGVQSGSKRVRDEIYKRPYTNEKVINQAKVFHKYNVSVRYDFIFNNPFETFEESLESIDMLLNLPQPYTVNLFSLKFFPNTDITRMALEAGHITKESLDDNNKDDHDHYLIRYDNTKNPDSVFINTLALYISFMSENLELQNKKELIGEIIEDFKKNRDVGPVKELLKPFVTQNDKQAKMKEFEINV